MDSIGVSVGEAGGRMCASGSRARLAAGSALLGALATLVVLLSFRTAFPTLFLGVPGLPVEGYAWSASSCPFRATDGPGLTFGPSMAEETLAELSADEVREVAVWFSKSTGAAGKRNASVDCVWMSGPSAIELIRPPKAEVLAYFEGKGTRPDRFARVTTVGPDGVQEYRVGPLVDGAPASTATIELLTQPGDIPYVKRPTEPNGDNRVAAPLLKRVFNEMAGLLTEAFGPVFPELDNFDPSKGEVGWNLRNDALTPPGQRSDILIILWFPPGEVRTEASWLHPLPLLMKLNTTSVDPSQWDLVDLYYCGQGPFETAAALQEAHSKGQIRICPFTKDTGSWDVPQRVTQKLPDRFPLEEHKGVSWGPWTFTVTQRPSSGLALMDIRFRGERIVYELSLQDAEAAYSGSSRSQFYFADAAWSLSMISASLEPGVDCPDGAHYVSAADWYRILPGGVAEADPTDPRTFYPICIFEWTEDHTIWRHMQNSEPPDVRGLLRKTIVVRSVATVGNYDYISDVKFREDGEIEVYTRFAGYIEARHFDVNSNPSEVNYSTIVRPGLAGPVHCHLVNWKADFDIAGVRENAMRITRVKVQEVPDELLAGSNKPFVSKYLEHTVVEKEGIGQSTFVAQPQSPAMWTFVDRNATSAAGNPRGYALTLGSWTNVQVLPDDHPFVRALPLTKYHVAVTKYHDDEYRSSSVYVQYDGAETTKNAQDVDRFLSDGESLLDEDLVVWVGVGKEHIVRQEDLPLVSNFGAGFSLHPWNFFTQNVAASPPWAA